MFKKFEIINRLKALLAKKNVRAALLVLVAIVAINAFLGNDDESIATEPSKELVTLMTPVEYVGGQSLSLIGNVRAFKEAKVTSERSGRIVSVNVELGQTVPAGQILATLENASERASVLQAEGQYEAALAALAQSGVGVDEARNTVRNSQNTALSTFKGAYNTANGVLINSIDAFFSNPNSNLPGLRINGAGYTDKLNSDRVNFQTLFKNWEIKVNSLNTDSDLRSELEYAKSNVQQVINMVDNFITIFSNQNGSDRYTEAELQTFSSTFTGLRSSLISLNSQVDSALNDLQSADETLRRAELSASGSIASASDAQVKQALGSLRAAQANLAKTILRTPIAGTVNSINVRTGDFINSFYEVGVIANNSALEVVTYVSDVERNLITEGDQVLIEGKYEGVITQISPAVDNITKKIEVRIATEGTDIFNGDTVRITKEVTDAVSENSIVQVPLTAVKFERENGFIFKVIDNKLVQQSVELGKILGSSVEIKTGLSLDDEFVVDVRGLIDGEEVEVTK